MISLEIIFFCCFVWNLSNFEISYDQELCERIHFRNRIWLISLSKRTYSSFSVSFKKKKSQKSYCLLMLLIHFHLIPLFYSASVFLLCLFTFNQWFFWPVSLSFLLNVFFFSQLLCSCFWLSFSNLCSLIFVFC